MNEKKIFQKIFKGEVFEQQGYKYRFDDLVENEKGDLVFKICWLPEFLPHSYFFDKMVTDCNIIIDNRLRYLSLMVGKNDEVDIYTEVSDLKKNLFIRKSLLEKINDEVKSLKEVRIEHARSKKTYIIGTSFSLLDRPYSPKDEGEYINLHFDLNILYVEDVEGPKGNRLNLNPEYEIEELKSSLSDLLWDNDIASRLDDIIIPILEPEIKIRDYDIFYSSMFSIRKINLDYQNEKVEKNDRTTPPLFI
jgi:hypothetical protein